MRLPSETRVAVCVYLDRFSLDALQMSDRKYREFVETNVSDVCLRRLDSCAVTFFGALQSYCVNACAENGKVLRFTGDQVGSWEAYVVMLRQSCVNYASIKFCTLTEDQCNALIRIGSTLYIHHLTLDNVDLRNVDSTTVPRVVDSLSGIHTLDVAGGRLPSTHVSDGLLNVCVMKGIRILRLPWKKPSGDDGVYAVTQEALLHCCLSDDSLRRPEWIEVSHIALHDDFFAKVIEMASQHNFTTTFRLKIGTFTGQLDAAAYRPYRRLTSRGEIYEIPANCRIQVRVGDQSFDGFELRCGDDNSDSEFFFATGS